MARALDSLGYCPHPTSSTSLAEEQRKGDRSLLLRLGVAGAAAGNVMLMALALYSGKFSGMGSEYLTLFRWGSLLIATPTVFWTGNVFFRGGLAALRTRTPHMDLPVSLGIFAGYLGSALNTIRARGDIYFDSLCTLIFLLLVGRYLQRTQQRRSSKAKLADQRRSLPRPRAWSRATRCAKSPRKTWQKARSSRSWPVSASPSTAWSRPVLRRSIPHC